MNYFVRVQDLKRHRPIFRKIGQSPVLSDSQFSLSDDLHQTLYTPYVNTRPSTVQRYINSDLSLAQKQ